MYICMYAYMYVQLSDEGRRREKKIEKTATRENIAEEKKIPDYGL